MGGDIYSVCSFLSSFCVRLKVLRTGFCFEKNHLSLSVSGTMTEIFGNQYLGKKQTRLQTCLAFRTNLFNLILN